MRTPYSRKRRFFFFPILIIVALFILSAIVRGLWNAVLVDVVAVKPITLWQAMGLLILSRLLIGGLSLVRQEEVHPVAVHRTGAKSGVP